MPNLRALPKSFSDELKKFGSWNSEFFLVFYEFELNFYFNFFNNIQLLRDAATINR